MGLLVKGFSVPHAHLHLIPLQNEGQNLEEKPTFASEEELKEIQQGLQKRVHGLI